MKRIFLQKKQNKTILELLREQGEYLDAPCSGKGTCGKCCIIIEETRKTDPPKQREKEVFTERELEEGWRLSCMTVPTDDLYVCIPEIRENQIQVQMEFVRNTKMESDVQATTVICENKIEDRAQIGSDGEIKPENMDTEKSVYGIAIDIGTTTLAAELISLTDEICLKTASSVNHQRAYGADVISRIRAAASGDAEKLRESILKDVRDLAETLLAGQDENVLNVSKIVIAGNTTMIHLLLGYSCVGLGAAPFTPVNLAPEDMTWGELNGEYEETRESGDAKESGVARDGSDAREHGYVRECGHTGINQTTKVQIMPGISAFVGGDITAGMMGCGMRPDKCEMLIDIGTNGEMVLAAGDHFLVSSVAAGPAFEGGNISCGMPGVPGAVCRAVLFGKNNMVTKTIGNKPAIGLCGTGIIDVMYELVRHHIVDTQGILGEPWFEKGFPVVPGKIYFTQEDIRQVQMAKAAICAGLEVLLQKSNISYEQIKKVYVAGGFGMGLDMEKALGIGLLPIGLRGKLTPVGNSALEGAARCLTHSKESSDMQPQEIAAISHEINLADTPEFQELYLKHMQFC
ncbi:ASKHA domain-containing protein [Roseburia intestinalis]|jgi:uncharacterized 2Fe-2S/4Fe-4S cluster protein (DUF4445 family)|uniref:ASKHA domain-containing protein n=1 Tax=Roseburia intestinalis TaxID=166486 RepID=UPI0022E191B7|nr:ASKHA domain-containing protein [Roseburia intestinalis]